jgi:tetratricopeptide (TPR) repeat protein
LLRGRSLADAGRHAHAIDDFNRAIALAPGPEAYRLRSRSHLALGEVDAAQRDSESMRRALDQEAHIIPQTNR